MTTRMIAILALAGAMACGGGSAAKSSDQAAAQSAAAAYQSTGQDMATTVAQYQAATASMPDLAACQAAEAEYESKMGRMMDRIRSISATMDYYMAGPMGGAAADMGCVAAAMAAEYGRHRAVACVGTDITANQTEAANHATTMTGWIEHQRVRYEQMGDAMGITPATSDDTWACVHHSDGTFTMDGHTWTPPQTTGTPTPQPTPTPWPAPCGGRECPCEGHDYGTGTGTPPTGTPPTGTPPTSGWGMPHGPMM